MPTPLYLVLNSLRTNDERPSVAAYPRAAVLGVFGGLPSPLLPLVASLVGNDFVQQHQLGTFHSWLLAGTGRNASGAPLIEAIAAHVRRASAAAWWEGPRPATPLLWCCLDWAHLLPAAARELVDASLAQYEVGAFETERDRRFAAVVSPAMLRRFKRGQLDSAVFAAAAMATIYRGPGLEMPGRTPSIVASRPLRAEVYACCVRPPPPAPPPAPLAEAAEAADAAVMEEEEEEEEEGVHRMGSQPGG